MMGDVCWEIKWEIFEDYQADCILANKPQQKLAVTILFHSQKPKPKADHTIHSPSKSDCMA